MNPTASGLWVAKLITQSPMHQEALQQLTALDLPDAWLAAGFVRNLVWDALHGYKRTTPLNDLDVIYFDSYCREEQKDRQIESDLKALSNLPWSVKNQARMHIRNEDSPYQSSTDAMRYWVEEETATAVQLTKAGEVRLSAPFGLRGLLSLQVTLNRYRPKPDAFHHRTSTKGWLAKWPKLTLVNGS